MSSSNTKYEEMEDEVKSWSGLGPPNYYYMEVLEPVEYGKEFETWLTGSITTTTTGWTPYQRGLTNIPDHGGSAIVTSTPKIERLYTKEELIEASYRANLDYYLYPENYEGETKWDERETAIQQVENMLKFMK